MSEMMAYRFVIYRDSGEYWHDNAGCGWAHQKNGIQSFTLDELKVQLDLIEESFSFQSAITIVPLFEVAIEKTVMPVIPEPITTPKPIDMSTVGPDDLLHLRNGDTAKLENTNGARHWPYACRIISGQYSDAMITTTRFGGASPALRNTDTCITVGLNDDEFDVIRIERAF